MSSYSYQKIASINRLNKNVFISHNFSSETTHSYNIKSPFLIHFNLDEFIDTHHSQIPSDSSLPSSYAQTSCSRPSSSLSSETLLTKRHLLNHNILLLKKKKLENSTSFLIKNIYSTHFHQIN